MIGTTPRSRSRSSTNHFIRSHSPSTSRTRARWSVSLGGDGAERHLGAHARDGKRGAELVSGVDHERLLTLPRQLRRRFVYCL